MNTVLMHCSLTKFSIFITLERERKLYSTNKKTDKQYIVGYKLSYLIVVQTFKILVQVVTEKSLTKTFILITLERDRKGKK